MDIRQELGQRKVPYQVVDLRVEPEELPVQPVPEPTSQLVRTVLLRTLRGYVVALVPAMSRIDLAAAARALRVERAAIASEAEVQWVMEDEDAREMTPFGSARGLLTLVDALLRGAGRLVFEGPGSHEGIDVKFEDFETNEHPVIARFSRSIGHLGHSWFPEDRLP